MTSNISSEIKCKKGRNYLQESFDTMNNALKFPNRTSYVSFVVYRQNVDIWVYSKPFKYRPKA